MLLRRCQEALRSSGRLFWPLLLVLDDNGQSLDVAWRVPSVSLCGGAMPVIGTTPGGLVLRGP
jgi:hypothetical protein